MHGFYGRVLEIDLNDRSFRITEPDEKIYGLHLGGKGLATRLLLDLNPAGVDPPAPENHLIFATGPAAGTRTWGGCRYGVYTKSPLTGFYLESYSGGRAPEALDAAGYDAVIIKGRAESLTAVSVSPEGCEFHDASELKGMHTYQSEDEAKERFAPEGQGYGKPGALVIGPAGEAGVKFACIENDYWRSAGRGGAGAVMGSKNLKALVFAGDRKRPVFDPDGLAEYSKKFLAAAKNNPGVKAYKSLGTTQMVAVLNTAGGFPTEYWKRGTADYWENLSGDTYNETHDVTPHACAKCLMACGRMSEITSGRHKGLKIEGPEYETIYAFGGLCMIEDIAEIAYLNDICDRLGMDTISAGNLAAFAMEGAKRGILDIDLEYGDADAAAELIGMIAKREGLGAVMAKGIRHAAAEWGMEDLAVHVKGMEPAGYDHRALKGMGLAYAVSDRGACHLRATFYKPELARMVEPDAPPSERIRVFLDFEDRLTVFDCLVLCRFYRDLYPWDELAELIRLLTGFEYSAEELRSVGKRATDLAREFNLREGLTPEDDKLPKAFHRPLEDGRELTREEFEAMLSEYYSQKGWDEQGRPAG
jgi:aldehyde:ferredoxin oxidoreductase